LGWHRVDNPFVHALRANSRNTLLSAISLDQQLGDRVLHSNGKHSGRFVDGHVRFCELFFI
jgi:hypothetical protein